MWFTSPVTKYPFVGVESISSRLLSSLYALKTVSREILYSALASFIDGKLSPAFKLPCIMDKLMPSASDFILEVECENLISFIVYCYAELCCKNRHNLSHNNLLVLCLRAYLGWITRQINHLPTLYRHCTDIRWA